MIATAFALGLGTSAVAQREERLLDTDWKFIRQDVSLDASSAAWDTVAVPHCWNAVDAERGKLGNPDLPYGYYRGPGWYARTIDAPAAWRARRVFLLFEAASAQAKVWLNGQLLGEHRGPFTAFCFELTSALRIGQPNELRVRVDNSLNEAIPPLSGDFNVNGGIYRPVHLIVTNPVCVTPIEFASPGVVVRQRELDDAHARIDVEARVANGLAQPARVTVEAEARDASGRVVASDRATATIPAGETISVTPVLTLDQPHRWNGRIDPYLYQIVVRVLHDGTETDAVTQPLGLRTIEITPDRGFLLNGKLYPIYGVNRHQDGQGKGWALSDSDHDRDFALIAEVGATAVRLAHYPQAFHVYDIADRMGILLWNELSLVDYLRSTPEFAANAEQQLREMILQRENHPSVMCWGLYNELRAPDAKAGLELIRHLNGVAKSLDPSRFTVAATNLMSRQPIHTVPDWIAFNAYPGWYGNLSTDTMAQFLTKRQADLDGKRLALSEYGAGASPDQHVEGPVPRTDTKSRWHPEEWQAIVHEQDWRDIVANRERLWGTFIWNMFDFAAAKRNEGEHTGINDKGLVTRDRAVRKDAFFFYQANWTRPPLVYIASRRLTDRKQPTTAVKVYSNCDTVELFVNRRSVGVAKPDSVRVVQWPEVALQPGENTIVVVGRRNDATVRDECRWTLHADAATAKPITSNALTAK